MVEAFFLSAYPALGGGKGIPGYVTTPLSSYLYAFSGYSFAARLVLGNGLAIKVLAGGFHDKRARCQ